MPDLDRYIYYIPTLFTKMSFYNYKVLICAVNGAKTKRLHSVLTIFLTKTIASQITVALSCHRVRGIFFLAVVFALLIM